MALETLDRTLWSFSMALAHVQNVTVARHANEVAKQPPKPKPAHGHWNPAQDPTVEWKKEGQTELLVALRDGDLIAQGRHTEERTSWAQGSFSGFGLHSGYHTSIRPEQWREGKYSFGGLTARDWEFIEVRMPRFIVKAIWPDFVLPAVPMQLPESLYSTPYLDVMQAAIMHFGLTAENQGKKECLLDWFLEQQVEGEPVSNKLADAMATLIRLPSAQRGGAKRVLGPDYRRAG